MRPTPLTEDMVLAGRRYYNRLEHLARQGSPRVDEVVTGIFVAMRNAAPQAQRVLATSSEPAVAAPYSLAEARRDIERAMHSESMAPYTGPERRLEDHGPQGGRELRKSTWFPSAERRILGPGEGGNSLAGPIEYEQEPTALLPCPFCGGAPKLHKMEHGINEPVECTTKECPMSRLWPDVRWWNRRAPSSATLSTSCTYCQSAAIREGNAIARAETAERLLKEARPYLDLIAPSVSKERPLVMVVTKCDAEALAKRIDTLIGEQA